MGLFGVGQPGQALQAVRHSVAQGLWYRTVQQRHFGGRAILYYLEFTEHKNTAHISSISRIDQEDYVWVDKFTIRNLELFSSNGSREKCAFADVVDRTLTPMGGRLLKRWIALPIKEIDRINERLDVVQRFYDEPDLAESVAEQISQVGDLERIASRIAAARVTPRNRTA